MKILIINIKHDPAAVGLNLWRSINEHTKHSARHLVYSNSWLKNITDARDLYYDTMDPDELAEMTKEADVLHFNQDDWTIPVEKTPGINEVEKITKHIIPQKHRILFHGHGGAWLLDPRKQVARCGEIGAGLVVCSPMDSAATGDTATWIPNAMILDKFHSPDWSRNFAGDLTIGMSANNASGTYKGRVPCEYMVEYLRKQHGHPVRFEFVTDMSLKDSLLARKKHHITVDNWIQGFTGMAGFEGLALGHVVFGRFDPLVRERWERFAPEMIPIEDIKGFDTCGNRIAYYCENREALIEKCRAGVRWIHDWYNEKRIVDLWIKYYEGLEPIKCKPTKP